MLSINTNLPSLIAQNSLKNSTLKLNTAIERMTTGFKINSAKDNAANYSIVTNMSTKINAYQVAEENVAMGLDLLDTANGGLDLISDKLTRLRALQEEAANGTYGEQSLKAINAEACAIVDEIERLYNTTEYNGNNLFSAPVEKSHDAIIPADAKSVSQAVAEGNLINGTTYTVNNASDLVALQDYVNNGNNTTDMTFIMTRDIDMSGVKFIGIGFYDDDTVTIGEFNGTFDGNNYEIKNLTINTNDDQIGLFSSISNATIKNIGVVNCNITGKSSTGGLVGNAYNSNIINCYTTGNMSGYNSVGGLVGSISGSSVATNCYSTASVHSNGRNSGGLIGESDDAEISNCYATGSVDGTLFTGGLIGSITEARINNCYATGNISGGYIGGLIGESSHSYINNCYATSTVNGSYTGTFLGCDNNDSSEFTNCVSLTQNGLNMVGEKPTVRPPNTPSIYTNCNQLSLSDMHNSATMAQYGMTDDNGWYFKDGYLPQLTPFAPDIEFGLQIGINGNNESRINITTSFNMPEVSTLRAIGLDNSTSLLSTIDDIIANVSAKQTEYGAAQNRLESALDEISTQYDNLISSRSTLRDADIASVSSEYIKQQILQQASATLLATANQAPALALQLL